MSTINPYSSPNPQPAEDPPLVAQLAVDGEGMTIEFEQTFDDLMLVTEYTWKRRRNLWNRYGWLGLILWLMALAFLPDGLLQQRDWTSSFLLLVCGAVLVAFWFRLVFFPRGVIRQTLQREYAGNKNLNVVGMRRITITPEFIIAASPLMQSAQRWNGIEKVLVYHDTILIFNSALSAFVLPRRAFNSDTHFQEFAGCAQKYMEAHSTDGVRIPL
jgi:hypothetical protein